MRTALLRSAILTVLWAWTGCSKPLPPAAPQPPTPVELAPVTYTTTAVAVRVPAVLARQTEAELSFKVRGVIAAVDVRAGDVVEAGQVLARLQLDEIDAQVEQARSGWAKANRDLERVEKLQAGRVATFENFQDARTAVDLAAAQVRIAEFNRRFAVITAPAAGRVLQRRAEPGEWVDSGHTILVFAADAEGWIARAGLSDRDIARVRVNDLVELRTAGGPASATGRVSHISAAAEPATRTTPIEIALDQPPADARSGGIVAATIQPQPGPARPVVAAAALIEGADDTASLFLVEQGTDRARRVRVEVEAIDGTSAYLRTPLPETARVVVRGAEYLRDGAPVAATK